MSVIRNLIVKITADSGGLQKGLTKAQKSVGGAVRGIEGSFGAIGTGIAAAAAGIAAAGAAIVAVARDTMPAYADSLEGETKLTTIMRQRMGASDGLVRSLMDLAGVEQKTGVTEEDAVIAGQQQLATFLHSADALRTLTPAMADLVAQQQGYHATAEGATSVANLMGKVLDGNTSALKRVGISFTAAQEKALKYGNETQRAAMLAQVITDNVGNMNQALGDTSVGRIVQLQNAWGNLKETVGSVFTNLLAAAQPALMRLINMVSTAANWVAQLISILTGNTVSFSGVASGAEDAADGMDDYARSAGGAGRAAKKSLAGFDQINALQKKGGGGGGGGSVSVTPGNGASGLDSIFKESDFDGIKKAVQWIKDTWEKIYENIKPSLDYIGKVIGKIKELFQSGGGSDGSLSWFFDNLLGNAAITLVTGFVNEFGDIITVFEGISRAVKGVITLNPVEWFNGLKDTMVGAFSLPADMVANIIDAVGRLFGLDVGASEFVQTLKSDLLNIDFGKIVEAIGTAFSDAWDEVTKIFAPIGTWFSDRWESVKKVFAPVATWFGNNFGVAWNNITIIFSGIGGWFASKWNDVKTALSPVTTWFRNKFDEAWTAIQNVFAPVSTFFSGVWDKIKTKFTDVGTSIGNAVGGAFKTAVNSVFATIENVVNGFIGTINSIIDTLRKIPGLGGLSTFSKLKLPRLETGGIATSSVLANIGEHGREAVLPLENHTGWMDDLAGRIGSQLAMAGGPGPVYVFLDGHQIAARVEQRRSRNSVMSNGRSR